MKGHGYRFLPHSLALEVPLMKKTGAYRYVICACSTGLMFINVGLLSTAFSAYFPYMKETLHFTNTQLYLLPTIRMISTILFTLFSDAYYRRFGIKKGCLAALLGTSAGFLLLSCADSFLLYEACMVLFGFSYAMGSIIPASLLVRQWFPDRFASAMGIVTAGSGISSVVLPMFISRVIPSFGLQRALLIEAAAVLALGTLIAVLIRESKAEKGAGTEQKTEDTLLQEKSNLNHRQSLRLYTAAFSLGCLALTAVAGLSMLYSTTGHTTEMASGLISFFGLALIAGKLIYGLVCDRIGSFLTNAVYCLLLLSGIVLCCMAQDAPYSLLLISVCLFSAGCSLATVGITVIAKDISAEENFGKTLKNIQSVYSIGGIISGTVPGIIADTTGSYVPAYRLFAAVAIVFVLALMTLYIELNTKTKIIKA